MIDPRVPTIILIRVKWKSRNQFNSNGWHAYFNDDDGFMEMTSFNGRRCLGQHVIFYGVRTRA